MAPNSLRREMVRCSACLTLATERITMQRNAENFR